MLRNSTGLFLLPPFNKLQTDFHKPHITHFLNPILMRTLCLLLLFSIVLFKATGQPGSLDSLLEIMVYKQLRF